MKTEITRLYRVSPNQNVHLKITIGFGQRGSTSVYVGADRIVDSKVGKVEVDLGKGSTLKGKMVQCSTLVQDVRGETNKTSVRYELAGGIKPLDEKLQKVVSEDGETVWYTATFIMV
jgi:hypothetical protein